MRVLVVRVVTRLSPPPRSGRGSPRRMELAPHKKFMLGKLHNLHDILIGCFSGKDHSFFFKFANIFSNHSNLATTIPSADLLEATFIFNGTANEVIDVTCINETDSTTPEGNFLLTQAQFALLTQFAQFRDGTFGTMGMFGAIDLITLFGVVFATIGFNRINESVGGFFMLVILGVMAFFQIIVWPTALSGAIAVVVMLVVMSTRKV